MSVASGTGEAGALARDATRVDFDGFHGDGAPGADCCAVAEAFIPAERDAVVRRGLRPPAGNTAAAAGAACGRCLGEVALTPARQELRTALPQELRMVRAVSRTLQ